MENDMLRDGIGLGLLIILIGSAQWISALFGV
jgi:hypothetical protein